MRKGLAVYEQYIPRSPFVAFHARRNRWACLVVHRRGGKTVACINDLIAQAVYSKLPNSRYAYIAPYYSQAKSLAWDYLKRYSAILSPIINESELMIEFPFNGARIRLFGADNDQALRGMYLDGVVLDEYADMRPRVWGEVLRPMLADRRGWAVFIGTPKGHNDFYDIHERAKLDKSWFSLLLKASKSGLLAQAELDDAKKTMTENQYRQEFECDFEAAIPGAVYGGQMALAEDTGRITEISYDTDLGVYTSWDIGFDDSTAIWFWQIAFGEIRIIDYYENNNESIAHYCEIIQSKPYKYTKDRIAHYVPHDAAHKLFAAGGRSIVEQAWGLGVKMLSMPATSQQNSIEATRKTLERCWFDRAKCIKGIEALKQYQFEWDDDRKMLKSKPRHDWSSHAADAFELMCQVWREFKTPKNEEKPKFLHEMSYNDLISSSNKKRDRRI